MPDKLELKTLGFGDPNFSGIQVLYQNGKATTVSIANAGCSGSTMYKVTPELSKALEVIAKKDAAGTAVTKGEHVTTLARALAPWGNFAIGNASSATNTFTTEGSTNALAAVHKKLTEAGQLIPTTKAGAEILSDLFRGAKTLVSHIPGVSHLPGINKLVAAGTILSALSSIARAETPEEKTTAKGAAVEAFVSVVDPSFGLVPYALQEGTKNAAANIAAARTNPRNLEINRAQDFLFSAEHPDQLGALIVRDKAGGTLDVRAALKDPNQRNLVLNEISKLEAAATTADGKDLFQRMANAANEFIELEGRRPKLDNGGKLIHQASAVTKVDVSHHF